MGQVSAISWTDATFNPWIGCTRISPACDNCYAERENRHRGWADGWGPGVPRHRTTPGYWRGPLRWPAGTRVFCASLADVFDNEVDQAWRDDLWALIRATPHLWWILLTKRIGNAAKMLPPDWPYPHVGLMATLENQEVFDRDWPKLARLPAVWRGVSMEPLLSPVKIADAQPDWIIVGGESGPRAREIHAEWVRDIRDQCAAANIPFHFKQWGGIRPKSNGCELDGVEHKAFPAAHEVGSS